MGAFSEDEKSHASSENDEDEEIDDLDGGDGDATLDAEADGEDGEDNGDGDEDDDQDDNQDVEESPSRNLPRPRASSIFDTAAQDSRGRGAVGDYSSSNGTQDTFEARRASMLQESLSFRPGLKPEAVSTVLYDIVPTIAAPHSTSINAITATPDMRWVFSGGSDGWVRKFNWVDTLNGRAMLTVAQRHPFVDSVQKLGMLVGYWENEDTRAKATAFPRNDESPSLSPIYSLAVHHQALWLLSGTESGAINLQAVRHDEGKRITSLYKHTSAVSVMSLSRDETSVLSGSWDKTINDWDLHTGQVKRSFLDSGGQISAIEIRPISDVPIPRDFAESKLPSSLTFAMDSDAPRKPSTVMSNIHDDRRPSEVAPLSPGDSLFGGGDSLFGDNDNPGGPGAGFDQDDDDNEFSRAFAGGVEQQPEAIGNGEDATMTLEPNQDLAASTGDEPRGNGAQDDLEMIAPPNASDDVFGPETHTVEETSGHISNTPPEELSASETIFLDAAIDGTLRVWDRRQPNPVARMVPPRGTPPWCMHACWSHDGNYIYAGRRNGTVDEYSIHKGLREPGRTLHLPSGSGAVSAVKAMPNSKHLVCASYDILRLYDLKDEENAKKSTVPFLIVPGHRTGVISQLYLDSTCSYMISTGGNRGWEGSTTEVMLGYEIGFAS